MKSALFINGTTIDHMNCIYFIQQQEVDRLCQRPIWIYGSQWTPAPARHEWGVLEPGASRRGPAAPAHHAGLVHAATQPTQPDHTARGGQAIAGGC